jgi:Tfp pilus assembly protein PilF
MDGRWQRLLVGCILCGLVGCSHFGDHPPKPRDTGEPPIAKTEDKRGPLSPATQMTVANLRLQASLEEGHTPVERDELQNQARLTYEQILKRDPKYLDAMIGMARLYAAVHDKTKCVDWYQKAAKAFPNRGDIPHEMGFALIKNFKDSEGALQCFHAATKADPENRTYRKVLGLELARSGRYEESYAWLSRALPTEADAHYNLAGMMEHNGQVDMAKREFALALQADPNHAGAKRAMAFYSGALDKPQAENVQRANYEQIVIPQQDGAAPSGLVTTPKPDAARRTSALPSLTPTSGWDR